MEQNDFYMQIVEYKIKIKILELNFLFLYSLFEN